MYINKKTGELVEAKLVDEHILAVRSGDYWELKMAGEYGEAMICQNKDKCEIYLCPEQKIHSMDKRCNDPCLDYKQVCIPYVHEQKNTITFTGCTSTISAKHKYDVDNEPVFPVCGTCNARKEIDTWHEKEVICPWCGHKHIDSWEMGTGEYVCSKCEKPFYVEKEIEVYYTTTKVEVKSDGK